MKKLLSLVIIVVGIVADQIFKNWIVANIQLGDTEKIWPNVLSLTYIKNDGAAWSSFSGQQWFFLVLTPIVLIVALIIAGALGNFIDRIRQGFVVDMFQTEFINFPIFNIADILLSVGFVLLFIAILTDKETK